MLHNREHMTVGVGDMKVSNKSGVIIVTHALGSCIGIAAHDINSGVGGILHYMLPKNPNDSLRPSDLWKYGDIAIPRFFQTLYKRGAKKESIRVVMVGGANALGTSSLPIGRKNQIIAERLFQKNSVFVDAQDTGGSKPRTFYLEIGTGRTWCSTARELTEL